MASLAGLFTGDWTPPGSRQAHVYFKAPPNALSEKDYNPNITQSYEQQQAARSQQDALNQLLTARANGTGGPSPAEMLLKSAMQQNAAQQAGALASNRSLNPALAARLIAQGGANLNAQEAGQAALLRAQEQLAAQGLLGQSLATQRAQDLGGYGTSIGGQQAQNQAQLGRLGLNLNAEESDALLRQRTNEANQKANEQVFGGLLNAGGAALGMGGIGGGGGGGGSGASADFSAPTTPISQQSAGSTLGIPQLTFSQGGMVPGYNCGGPVYEAGGVVPGNAKVAGDSEKNDTVNAKLSPGEVVVPRSVVKQSPEKQAAFIRAVEAHHTEKAPKGAKPTSAQMLAEVRRAKEALASIEAKLSKGKKGKS